VSQLPLNQRNACNNNTLLSPRHRRYETCSSAPVIVGEWSLAIDNCMDAIDRKFADYGQCDRIHMRKTDPWWDTHIK
jgi:hypothetical protein